MLFGRSEFSHWTPTRAPPPARSPPSATPFRLSVQNSCGAVANNAVALMFRCYHIVYCPLCNVALGRLRSPIVGATPFLFTPVAFTVFAFCCRLVCVRLSATCYLLTAVFLCTSCLPTYCSWLAFRSSGSFVSLFHLYVYLLTVPGLYTVRTPSLVRITHRQVVRFMVSTVAKM